MVKRVLTTAGFVEGVTFRETLFRHPPKTSYAVYLDSYNRRGADDGNLITAHDYTIELYSYKTDEDSEIRIEKAMDVFGIEYHKDGRYWIESEQLYQVVYTFSHIDK